MALSETEALSPILDSPSTSRRREAPHLLYKTGAYFLSLAERAYFKSPKLPWPFGPLTQSVGSIASPVTQSMQHQWLALLYFIDEEILTVEDVVKFFFPTSRHVFEAINTLGDDFLEFFVNMIESSMDYFPSMIHKFMDANFVLTFTLNVLTLILSACTRDHQKEKEDFAPVPEETQPTEADDDGGDEVQFVDKFVGVDNQKKKEDFTPVPEDTQSTEADDDGGDEEQFVDKFVGVDETINTVDSIAGRSKKDVLETHRGEKNEEGCNIGLLKNEEGCKVGMEKNKDGCKKKNEEGRKIGIEKNEEECKKKNEEGRKIGMEKNEKGSKKKNEGGRKIGMEKNEEGCKKKNEGGRNIGMEKNEEGCKQKNEEGRKIGMEKNEKGRKIGMEKQIKAQPSSNAAKVDKTHVRNTDQGITVDPVLRLFDSKWIQM